MRKISCDFLATNIQLIQSLKSWEMAWNEGYMSFFPASLPFLGLYVVTNVISLCIIKELVTGELLTKRALLEGFHDLKHEEVKTLHASDIRNKTAQAEGSVCEIQ